MATIQDVITNLENIGIFQFFLPFILLFAVFYGVLSKTKIFGNQKDDPNVNKINAIVSFAAAAFIMLYPATSVAVFTLTDYLANFVGGTLIYVFAILAFLLVMFMIAVPLGGGEGPKFAKAGTMGVIVAIVLVAALFLSSGGTQIFPGVGVDLRNYFTAGFFFPYVDPTVLALVLVLVILAVAIYWVVK